MTDEKTVYFQPVMNDNALVYILDKRRQLLYYPLKKTVTIGREYEKSTCDIRVHSQITGRNHGEIRYNEVEKQYYYIDHGSVNGTYINGQKMETCNPNGVCSVILRDGDVLRIDRSNIDEPHAESVLIFFCRSYNLNAKWMTFDMKRVNALTIGRTQENTIVLPNLMVSRRHAVIMRNGQNWIVEDQDSQNGISINGQEVRHRDVLHDHDVIRIANAILILWFDILYYTTLSEDKNECLSVNIKRKTVNLGRKTLLRNINFEAQTRDFVLILGGSGAGKTTLINAVLGEKKADGKIYLDGKDLYKNFKSMKAQIGLVPQFINLRLNDKVEQTLMDIAEIKLDSRQYSKEDKRKQVHDTLKKVGVFELKNHLISQLSGGQKKKVSVAAQLIGFQKVFICDEPDSGLDAASRTQQMEILKEIADNGKIVMVISHEPDDAVDKNTGESLFTKVLVIAKSKEEKCGRMAFYGTPKEALKYFGVKKLQDIMIEINPLNEGGKDKADYYIKRYERN